MTIAQAAAEFRTGAATAAALAARSETALSRTFWIALALAAVSAIATILAARGLAYDGSYYLLGLASRGSFQLWEPARHSTQFLQQVFAFAGERLGVRNCWTLGILFSLGTAGWPIVITALCWFALPPGRKSWIAGPLLNLVFAVPATNFIGIGEGIIASCLLWLAFLLVLFRTEKPLGALIALAAVAACTLAHESAALCLLAIAVGAALQFRRTKGFCRAAAIVTSLVALAGAAYMLRWCIFPRSALERGDFLQGLLGGFVGTKGAPNVPALASFLCAIALAIGIVHARAGKWATGVAVLGSACLFAILWLAPAEAISPSRYFAARGLPIALTTALMCLTLFLWRSGESPARFATPSAIVLVLALAAGQMSAQFAMTRAWQDYVDALHTFVGTERGAIPHGRAMAILDPGGTRFRRELLEHWSVQPLSILLAPAGRVQAVLEPAPWARWAPYNLSDRAHLPRAPGLDWSRFRARP